MDDGMPPSGGGGGGGGGGAVTQDTLLKWMLGATFELADRNGSGEIDALELGAPPLLTPAPAAGGGGGDHISAYRG